MSAASPASALAALLANTVSPAKDCKLGFRGFEGFGAFYLVGGRVGFVGFFVVVAVVGFFVVLFGWVCLTGQYRKKPRTAMLALKQDMDLPLTAYVKNQKQVLQRTHPKSMALIYTTPSP